jgi:competence protein ComEC
MSGGADTPLGARLALWGARETVSLLLTSFVAGSATTLYAAYHFHRLAPYGALANLLAMPVVSAWVMPMGIAGALLVPFGFDDIFWQLMGYGLDWMIAVAFWVTSLPGAVGRITAFGVGPLLLGTAGLIVLSLLKSPLRYGCGGALIAVAVLWAVRTPQPDVLVAPNGDAVAVRAASGRFAMFKSGSDTFAFQLWLAADADGRSAKDKALGEGLSCDSAGCIGHLADGSIVAISRTNQALEEDCRGAALVITAKTVPAGCDAVVIDRKIWERYGALGLRRAGEGWHVEAARPDGYARPWTRSAWQDDSVALPRTLPAQPRDATPRPEDLEPGG